MAKAQAAGDIPRHRGFANSARSVNGHYIHSVRGAEKIGVHKKIIYPWES
jgi:hypothetical protein